MDLSHLIEKLDREGTDRLRKVMRLANREAQQMAHDYIGTEHLLLAILREGGGIAVRVLKAQGVTANDVCKEVRNLVEPSPDFVGEGKLPHVPRAMTAFFHAQREAQKCKSKLIGTEHLLLGLLRDQMGVAAQVLMNLGLRLDELEQDVRDAIRIDTEGNGGQERAATP
ncbi:MAG: Clp protease N-terminal domain-containing protein [Thermoguttaceae bacterium]